MHGDECHRFGSNNGCQPHCPVLKKGKCETQREMELDFIRAGEMDIEEGSPCIEDGCDGRYEIVEHNPGHPTAYRAALECSECTAEAPSREEIRQHAGKLRRELALEESISRMLKRFANAIPEIQAESERRRAVAAKRQAEAGVSVCDLVGLAIMAASVAVWIAMAILTHPGELRAIPIGNAPQIEARAAA